MIFYATEKFKKISNSKNAELRGFKYKFGRNELNYDPEDVSQENYEQDFLSNEYVAECVKSLDSTISLAVNPQEDDINIKYKYLYLLYDDLLTGELGLLAGLINIEGLNLSQQKNYFRFTIDISVNIDLLGSELLRHTQEVNHSNNSTNYLGIQIYNPIILDKLFNGEGISGHQTITTNGIII